MKLIKADSDSRMYVMECNGGLSCYGFDVIDIKARAIAQWLLANAMPCSSIDAAPGTSKHFNECVSVMEVGRKFSADTGKRCGAELVPELIGHEGKRVECTYFGERIRFTVGKSSGWMPVHLQLHNSRSYGGGALIANEVSNVKVSP